MKKINLIFILIIFSCTKEVSFDIPVNENNIVVNGFIENGETAKVLLTKSVNPFNFDGDLNEVLNNFVHDATIIVTDNYTNESDTLINMTPISMGPPLCTDTWFYNYFGNNIIGEEEKTYSLKVITNNDTITSKTTIPKSKKIDKLEFIYRETDSTYCYFLATYSDPDTIGNCVSLFSKTLGSDYIQDPIDLNSDNDYYSAPFFKRLLDNGGNYNDEYTNGITFPFPVYNGPPDWWEEVQENEVDAYSGQTIGFWEVNPRQKVVLKISHMDINSWNFWASMINNNSPGIFGTPSNIQSNIQGGTGIWYGTSSTYDTIITAIKVP